MAWISITFFYRTFWFISLHLSKSFCSILSLSIKVHWPKTCVTLLLHSLLPFAKRIEGLIVWVLLCLPSPSSKRIQRSNCLRILLILPFPLNKRFQGTNRLRYLLFPFTKIQGTNRLRIFVLTYWVYILCGTSRSYIYLGCNTENKRWYISCGSVQVEHTST